LRYLICSVPYPMEGMLRREMEMAGATLDHVFHADDVKFEFSLADNSADQLITRLNDAAHGRIRWFSSDQT